VPKSAAASSLFVYSNGFNHHTTAEQILDVILCDEAHRLRITSSGQYTPKHLRSTLTQAQELIRASKVSVFFLDQRQNVRPGEIGTIDGIREAASTYDAHVEQIDLYGQFRCNGSNGYIDWVTALMSDSPGRATAWHTSEEYRFEVFDDPGTMEQALHARVGPGMPGRIVAGYCWPWSDPAPDGTLEDDIVIGDFAMPWNARPDAGRLASGIPKSNLRAHEPGGIDQVGCIYTAQGFEFDYAGVIFGPDLVYREAEGGWVARLGTSHDSLVKRSRDRFVDLVKNTYRVLLSREIRGCYVHFQDAGTRDYVRSLVDQNVPRLPRQTRDGS